MSDLMIDLVLTITLGIGANLNERNDYTYMQMPAKFEMDMQLARIKDHSFHLNLDHESDIKDGHDYGHNQVFINYEWSIKL